MNEAAYQNKLTRRLKEMFPGCVVLKNNPDDIQGVPDLTILHGNRWASLEVKISSGASLRPNQKYYVEMMDDMSFAAFIYPENEEEVLSELQRAFEPNREARIS